MGVNEDEVFPTVWTADPPRPVVPLLARDWVSSTRVLVGRAWVGSLEGEWGEAGVSPRKQRGKEGD